MSEDGFIGLAERRVVILGLGLMGGSLALALRGKCTALLGYDHDPQTVRLAEQQQMVDQASTELNEVLPGTDLILLAAPVMAILELLDRLGECHPGPAVVMDLGSTKTQVVRAMALLPERFDPLGGHPMCGTEKASLLYAEPDLYRGAVFALAPLARTTYQARKLALEMLAAIGSQPLWLEAEEHDRWVASTSHLPYLLANALAISTPAEAAALAGAGFLSTSRLASSYAPMMLDVLRTNRVNILRALRRFRENLDEFDALLENEDFPALADLLKKCTDRHQRIRAERQAVQ
jgi:prephenate dehydrogenase